MCIPRRSDTQREPGRIPPAGQGPSQQGLRHPLQHLRRAGGANVAPTEPHADGVCDLGGEDSEKSHGLGQVLPRLRLGGHRGETQPTQRGKRHARRLRGPQKTGRREGDGEHTPCAQNR